MEESMPAAVRTRALVPRSAESGFLGPLIRLARSMPRRAVLGGGMILLVLASWEVLSARDIINSTFFSSPSRAIVKLYDIFATGYIWPHLWSSASAYIIGFLTAIVIGVILGTLIAWYKVISDAFEPLILAFYSVPRIAMIPLLILIIGFGAQYKIVCVVLLTFFPILINTIAGVKNVDLSLIRMSKSFGATDAQLFRTVAVPAAVPYILAAIRQSSAHGMTGVVAAEFFASHKGLGYVIARSTETFQSDQIYAVILILAVTGVLMVSIVQRVESSLLKWRPER